MKRLLFVVALCLMAGFVFAQESTRISVVTVKMLGTIIDNMCADAHKADLVTFIKTHPKSCALMPEHVASGYSIYSNGKLYRFDNKSTAKIEEFLKKEKSIIFQEESSLDVVITAEKIGSTLSLLTIKNQEKKEIPKLPNLF